MALKKDYKFPERLISLSHYAFALSHPARILIVETLIESKQCSFKALEKMIPLAQSSISQHLRALEKVYFIQTVELNDNTTGYQLHKEGFPHGWKELKELLLVVQ